MEGGEKIEKFRTGKRKKYIFFQEGIEEISLSPFLLLLFMTVNVYISDESRPIMTIPRANIAIATDERDEERREEGRESVKFRSVRWSARSDRKVEKRRDVWSRSVVSSETGATAAA